MTLEELKQQHDVVATIDLSEWTDDYEASTKWLRHKLRSIYQSEYTENQRIVFLHTKDYYVQITGPVGLILRNLQIALNEEDISNFFAVILSTCPDIEKETT